jgi:hypothetical protein
LQWFEKVNESQLSGNDRDKFNFKKGTVSLIRKIKKEATTYFNKVVNSQSTARKAKYLGFMAYEEMIIRKQQIFDAVSGEEKYKEKLSYYQADMNFKLGEFQKSN